MVVECWSEKIDIMALGLLLKLLPIYGVFSFNLDYEYTVVKQGPQNSLFGFSVLQHKEDVSASETKYW